MALLKFLEDLESTPFQDFWSLSEHEVPDRPGVYILAARPGMHYTYPVDKSPIFYIGQAGSLRARLRAHLKHATEAKCSRRFPLYWPRYEFAAAHGGRYCYIRTKQGQRPKVLEDIVLARFAKRYLSFPIANGAGAWRRVNKEFENA
jgi:hypothetical protein